MKEAPEQETPEAQPQQPQRKAKIRPSDIIIFGVIIVVIAVLSVFIYNRTVLKRDVSNAKVVSTKAIDALQKQDGASVWKLGSKDFQSLYSADALTAQLKKGTHLDLQKMTLDHQIAYTSNKGRTVYFIYRFDDLKVPYYVRTGIHHQGDKWYLVTMSSSTDPSGTPTDTTEQ